MAIREGFGSLIYWNTRGEKGCGMFKGRPGKSSRVRWGVPTKGSEVEIERQVNIKMKTPCNKRTQGSLTSTKKGGQNREKGGKFVIKDRQGNCGGVKEQRRVLKGGVFKIMCQYRRMRTTAVPRRLAERQGAACGVRRGGGRETRSAGKIRRA